ncbi:hypothetical protein ES702_03301 [subsurface metagenome]
MGFVYRVYHRDRPDHFVELEFEEKQTPMRVRDRACREHHYPWAAYTQLVVKRVRGLTFSIRKSMVMKMSDLKNGGQEDG